MWHLVVHGDGLRRTPGSGRSRLDRCVCRVRVSPKRRDYEAVVAISRSGTTTEVADVLGALGPGTRKIAIVGVADSPVALAADDVIVLDFADERSVVQTRFATTTLALLRAHLGEDIEPIAVHAERALLAEAPYPPRSRPSSSPFSGRTGLSASHTKRRSRCARLHRDGPRPIQPWITGIGPIAIACPGRAVWPLGAAPAGLEADVLATGADWIAGSGLDPLAELLLAQRVAVARAHRLGLDADHPRNLSRSVVLR